MADLPNTVTFNVAFHPPGGEPVDFGQVVRAEDLAILAVGLAAPISWHSQAAETATNAASDVLWPSTATRESGDNLAHSAPTPEAFAYFNRKTGELLHTITAPNHLSFWTFVGDVAIDDLSMPDAGGKQNDWGVRVLMSNGSIRDIVAPDGVFASLADTRKMPAVDAKDAEIARLRAQLPDEMQDCTIRFIVCEVGHRRLTATHWLDEGCPYCKIAGLQSALRSATDMMNVERVKCDALTIENAELRKALDLARAEDAVESHDIEVNLVCTVDHAALDALTAYLRSDGKLPLLNIKGADDSAIAAPDSPEYRAALDIFDAAKNPVVPFWKFASDSRPRPSHYVSPPSPPDDAFTRWAIAALAEQAKVKPDDPRSSALSRAVSAQRPPDAYGR